MKTLFILVSTLFVSVSTMAQSANNTVHEKIDFGVKRTYYSYVKSFRYTNTNKSVLGIKEIRTRGADYSDRNNCPAYLAPGASCVFHVIFNPLSPGLSTGTLYFETDETLHILDLTGVGVD
jgi:hypothetical protein